MTCWTPVMHRVHRALLAADARCRTRATVTHDLREVCKRQLVMSSPQTHGKMSGRAQVYPFPYLHKYFTCITSRVAVSVCGLLNMITAGKTIMSRDEKQRITNDNCPV